MNRLLRLVPFRFRLDRRTLKTGAEALFWIAAVFLLETYGRQIPTDWMDIFVGAFLVGLSLATGGIPLRFELPRGAIRLVHRATSRIEMVFDARYGADFHPEREPRPPRHRRFRRLVMILALVDLALFGAVLRFGSPLLALLRFSYVAYLITAALVWLGVAVTLISLLLTLLQELRLAPGRIRLPRTRRRLAAILAGAALGAALLVALDEFVGAQGWLFAMLGGLLLLLPPRFGPPVEFRLNLRVRRTGAAVPRIETTTVEEMVRSFLGVLVLGSLGLTLIVQGHRLPFAFPAPDMADRLPIAHYTGRAVAWVLGAGTFAAVLLYIFEFTWRRARTDPAWPGLVAADREPVIARVEENLALARSGRRDRGEGFLFAPHWWPSDRMYRDSWHEDDLSEGSAGPDFHRHYGRPARRLLRRMLRALAIDLIYIEDGVPAPRLGDVMRFLFRHYDASGGTAGCGQILAERHVVSPPGLHLALQEIEIDERKLGVETRYREPSYESLSRARVLLVLRERGGDEVPEDDPFAFTREPGWVDRLLSRVPVGPVVSGA